MELRHLRYFVAVGEEEHFGRAAERLHVVQPALTRQVRQLEEELGCALFERLKWGVRLTEAGKSFLDEARRLLSDLGRGVERTRLVAQGKVGRLRVAFSEAATYGGEELPSILRHFRGGWPDVRLDLSPSTSLSAVEQVRNREVDVAFVYIPPSNPRELGSHTISVERVVLALPQAHPLVTRKRLSLRDLNDEPLIVPPRTAATVVYDAVLSACRTAGVRLKVAQEVASYTTMLSLVAGGIGLSFVVESAERTKPDGVVLRDIGDLRVKAQLFAVWRKDNTAPALLNFVEMIRSKFAEVARH